MKSVQRMHLHYANPIKNFPVHFMGKHHIFSPSNKINNNDKATQSLVQSKNKPLVMDKSGLIKKKKLEAMYTSEFVLFF